MGLSFPNPIKAAQNAWNGAQRTVGNAVQNVQRTATGAVQTVQRKAGEAQSFLNKQVNNVRAQAQGAQRQVNSLANKAQRSLNNAVQSNVVRPVRQARNQASSTIHKAQNRLNSEVQNRVVKPVQQAQRQASSTIRRAQNRFNNEVQSRVVKPLQQTQHKVEKSLSNTKHQIERNAQQLHKNFDQSVQGTQKKIGQTLNSVNNNVQKNVVKPLQQTQRNVEQNLNKMQKQINSSATTATNNAKDFTKSVLYGRPNTANGKQADPNSKSEIQRLAGQSSATQAGTRLHDEYNKLSNSMNKGLTKAENWGAKTANSDLFAGVDKAKLINPDISNDGMNGGNPESLKIGLNYGKKVVGELTNLGAGMVKGIGGVVNRAPTLIGDAAKLMNGQDKSYNKKDDEFGSISGAGKLAYGMGTGLFVDLPSRILAPGSGHTWVANKLKSGENKLNSVYENYAKSQGVNTQSKTYKTSSQLVQDVGTGVATVAGLKAAKGSVSGMLNKFGKSEGGTAISAAQGNGLRAAPAKPETTFSKTNPLEVSRSAGSKPLSNLEKIQAEVRKIFREGTDKGPNLSADGKRYAFHSNKPNKPKSEELGPGGWFEQPNPVENPNGKYRAGQYQYAQHSAKDVIKSVAGENPLVYHSTSGKTTYRNRDTGNQVVYDNAGKYFRVEVLDKKTGRTQYVGADGKPIDTNVLVQAKNKDGSPRFDNGAPKMVKGDRKPNDEITNETHFTDSDR